MDIVVIAGFLGSGKTSVLLHLARPLARAGVKVAVIENEVGKVGVDDQLVAAEGLPVRELYSGCICCSLRLDLISTLLDLERTFNPDVVLLEPSGVAGPDLVLDALIGYGGEINRKVVVVVVDATRAGLLQAQDLPIVTRGIRAADLLLINKADAVTAEVPIQTELWMRTLNTGAPALAVSAQTGEGMDEVATQISLLMSPPRRPAARAERPQHERTDIEMATFSWKGKLSLSSPVAGVELQQQLAALLRKLAVHAAGGGDALAGHIKAIFREGGADGYWSVSTTSAACAPQARGRLSPHIQSGELTLNAIVYGVTTESLAEAFHVHRQETCFAGAEGNP